jgi:hypothetical protein
MYIHSEADIIYFCGDLNGRTGNLIEDIDMLPPRLNIDDVVEGHGEAIINFATDCKLCLLNGRLNPENDNFTLYQSKVDQWLTILLLPMIVLINVLLSL